MPTQSTRRDPDLHSTGAPLRWRWVLATAFGGAILVTLFLAVVDPGLARPRVSATLVGATLVLTGLLVGYGSPGRTTLEPGVGGLMLIVVALLAAGAAGSPLPGWLPLVTALVAAPVLAVAGAWAGEMLQGTYDDPSEGVQWLWVLVAIVMGFAAGVYSLYLAEAMLGLNYLGLLGSFAASFMLTGLIVGYFSPGETILEPAIAAVGIVVLDVTFALLQFHALFPAGAVLLVVVAGIVLSVTGAWIGEAAQQATQGPHRAGARQRSSGG